MKKRYFIFFMCAACSHAFGATITNTASGLWSDTGTWAGGVVPGTGDDVLITTGVVTNNSSTNCASLLIDGAIYESAWVTTLEVDTSIVMTNSATVRHSKNSATFAYGIYLSASNITVDSTSLFDGAGRGYAGGGANQNGYGPGKGYTLEGAGGGAGYGGDGGDGEDSNNGGVSYGSRLLAASVGSGGAGHNGPVGGAGGGQLSLVCYDLTLNGTIDLSGANPSIGNNRSGGGGSGGGAYLEVSGTITGSGSIYLTGGALTSSQFKCGGGGGGGRFVFIGGTYDFMGSIDVSGAYAFNGEAGEDGTIYIGATPTAEEIQYVPTF